MRVVETVDELLVSHRLFDRVEICPLYVFDDRYLENFLVRQFAHENGYGVQACPLGSSPAPFTRNDLIGGAFAHRPHDDRLEDSLFRY